MTLHLYNTRTHKKEPFSPLRQGHVGLYVCGPTVYDAIHIGNARPLVVFDTLYRLLQALFPHVTYVRNITDVDDKINARAQENQESLHTLTTRTTEQFQEDAKALGCQSPDHEPRATEHIPHMIRVIERILAHGHAYTAHGHVLFDTSSWSPYGAFARRDLEEQHAGARVKVASYKRSPEDFVLWKPSQKGEPHWDSPWGPGRPGWHIECSAMSMTYLGQEFDIHGGGQDLIFPHHQNEIAQSCCAFPGTHFAQVWMHNGYVLVEGQKMSKSLGNVHTVASLRDTFPGEALRLSLLQTHYRQPLDFSIKKCQQAQAFLNRGYRLLLEEEETSPAVQDELANAVTARLSDDLDTPGALAVLAQALRSPHKGGLKEAGRPLGLFQESPSLWFQGSTPDATARWVEDLIAQRQKARDNKDFSTADLVRDQLARRGITLDDKKDGTTLWHVSHPQVGQDDT